MSDPVRFSDGEARVGSHVGAVQLKRRSQRLGQRRAAIDTAMQNDPVLKPSGITYVIGVLLLAACSGTPTSSASPGSSPPSTPASPSAAPPPTNPYQDNTKLVCADLTKVEQDQALAYITELTKYGPANTVTDPKKRTAMIAAAKKAMTNWAAALRALAPRADDPAFKQAINAKADASDQAAATITTWEDLTSPTGAGPDLPALTNAAAAVESICSR